MRNAGVYFGTEFNLWSRYGRVGRWSAPHRHHGCPGDDDDDLDDDDDDDDLDADELDDDDDEDLLSIWSRRKMVCTAPASSLSRCVCGKCIITAKDRELQGLAGCVRQETFLRENYTITLTQNEMDLTEVGSNGAFWEGGFR